MVTNTKLLLLKKTKQKNKQSQNMMSYMERKVVSLQLWQKVKQKHLIRCYINFKPFPVATKPITADELIEIIR